jgi:hypothetical protein
MSVSILRTQRDALLAASDFLMLPDVIQDEAKKTATEAYRLMLRDSVFVDITDEEAAEVVLPLPSFEIAGMLGIDISGEE